MGVSSDKTRNQMSMKVAIKIRSISSKYNSLLEKIIQYLRPCSRSCLQETVAALFTSYLRFRWMLSFRVQAQPVVHHRNLTMTKNKSLWEARALARQQPVILETTMSPSITNEKPDCLTEAPMANNNTWAWPAFLKNEPVTIIVII